MEGKLLKALRIYNDMTQEEFAEKLGVHRVNVSYVESGNRPISERLKMAVAREFSIDDDVMEMFSRLRTLEEFGSKLNKKF